MLSGAGHEVVALCASGFEGLQTVDLPAHLGDMGVTSPGRFMVGSRNLARYTWRGVDVNFLCTTTAKGQDPVPADVGAYNAHVHRLIREYRPQVTVCYGMHRSTHEAMRLAKKAGARSVFTLYNFGYEKRSYFEHVDRVLSDSAFLAMYYQQAIGLRSFVLSGPFDPTEVIFESGERSKLVFVNPAPHKGAGLASTLFDMLCARRPDIRVQVVSSFASAETFRAMVAPETAEWIEFTGPFTDPRDYLGSAKFLIVPSLAEALGRVCIEAMMNGIPCIGVNHGGVPEAMAGTGVNLPIPKRLAQEPATPVPTEEAEEWFAAVVKMWDDAEGYESHCRRCLQVAETKFGLEVQQQRVIGYFEAVAAGK